MKQTIRLNESDLHRIIKESVKKVLRESSYDINSPEYKQSYDKGRGYDSFDIWSDEADKEVRGYEALPDKARHPYGTEIPDLSNRIKNRPWKVKWSDKLASKSPNSILKKQQKKRSFPEDLELSKHYYPFSLWCRENGINLEQVQDDERVDLFRECLLDLQDEKEKRNWWREYEDY